MTARMIGTPAPDHALTTIEQAFLPIRNSPERRTTVKVREDGTAEVRSPDGKVTILHAGEEIAITLQAWAQTPTVEPVVRFTLCKLAR